MCLSIEMFMIRAFDSFLELFVLRSTCCDAPMVNDNCHDAFGDMPIYSCVNCNTEYI